MNMVLPKTSIRKKLGLVDVVQTLVLSHKPFESFPTSLFTPTGDPSQGSGSGNFYHTTALIFKKYR